MGDYWDKSGFYEQREIQAIREQERRDEAMADMHRNQQRMIEHLRNEEAMNQQRNSSVGYGGSSVSGGYDASGNSLAWNIGYALGRLFARPLVQVGTLPALISYGIFVAVPLALAAIYFFRSVPHWLLITLVSLLLASSSPLLVKIIRAIVFVAIGLVVLGVIILIAGTVFHWWHAAPTSPTPATQH